MREEPESQSWTDDDLEKAGVPPILRHCTRSSWRGPWPRPQSNWGQVFITGPVGSGKSHVAVALLRGRAERETIRPGRGRVSVPLGDFYESRTVYGATFADIQEACERMKPGQKDEQLATGLRDAALLVFDDLGAERLTDFTLDRVSLILRHRYNWMLPTIVTSNLTPSQLNDIDPRLASRLLSGDLIKLTGEDARLV